MYWDDTLEEIDAGAGPALGRCSGFFGVVGDLVGVLTEESSLSSPQSPNERCHHSEWDCFGGDIDQTIAFILELQAGDDLEKVLQPLALDHRCMAHVGSVSRSPGTDSTSIPARWAPGRLSGKFADSVATSPTSPPGRVVTDPVIQGAEATSRP